MQGHVLHFKCGFDWFEAILADSRPENVKNAWKMSFFGKTPGVNGLIPKSGSNVSQLCSYVYGDHWPMC